MPNWKSWTPPQMPVATATYVWSAPYAYYVHEHQGDNWTDKALSGSNLPSTFAGIYQSTHNLQAAFIGTTVYFNQRLLDAVPVKTGALKASQFMILS